MSGLEVDVAGRVGGFAIEVGFASDGGVTALFGHSGAGKSTVVNMIGGVVRPTRGRVVVGGRAWTGGATAIPRASEQARMRMRDRDGRAATAASGRWGTNCDRGRCAA